MRHLDREGLALGLKALAGGLPFGSVGRSVTVYGTRPADLRAAEGMTSSSPLGVVTSR